jgi:putative endonuclease
MRAFFMGYSVYILYSEGHDSYYIGQTQDVQERVRRHNAKLEAATSRYAPWTFVLRIEKNTRAEAVVLEKKLKNLNRQKLLVPSSNATKVFRKQLTVTGPWGPDATKGWSGFRLASLGLKMTYHQCDKDGKNTIVKEQNIGYFVAYRMNAPKKR